VGTDVSMHRLTRVPQILLGGVAGVAAAGVSLGVDTWVDTPQIAAASARSLLGATFGALITAGAFAFWMLPIATQLAASSVPTSIASEHLRDRFQRKVIAATVCALAYTGTVLVAVPPTEAGGAPLISTVLGGAIGVSGISFLLVAIRHAQRSTRPGELLAEAASDVMDQIRRTSSARRPGQIAGPIQLPPTTTKVLAPRTGWVNGIDEPRLLDALHTDGLVRLHVAVGAFVVRDWTPIAEVSSSADEATVPPDEGVARCVDIGSQRSAREDLGGSLARFADVAVHAASDQTGSPSMAYESLWYLGAVLHELVRHDVEMTDRVADRQKVLERPREPSGDELAGSVIDRIRLATSQRVSLAVELTRVLDDVRRAASKYGRRDLVELLEHQRDLVYEQCKQARPLGEDLERVAAARADGDARDPAAHATET
jgi:uncharacterized membrane protein